MMWASCSFAFSKSFRVAVARYAEEVRSGAFPSESHSFAIKDDVVKRLYGG